MNKVYILLGANLGAPFEQLGKAREAIETNVGKIVAASKIYESEAWGVEDQPVFLNQVLCVETACSPIETLDSIQAIETDLGRVRLSKWGARVIDIDILYFNDEVIADERLSVPHPYIQERRFTLVPLAEIAPLFDHPKLGLNSETLLARCADKLNVTRYNP